MKKSLSPLYKFLRGFTIATLPIILILFSISTNLPNAKLHKDTLKDSDFYQQLSGELKNYQPGYSSKNAFTQLIFASVAEELATPGWLQNLFEKNIDLTSAWLKGDDKNWNFYLPTQDVNLAVSKRIDQETKGFAEKYQTNISTCSTEEANKLKSQGFETNQNFCLPETVKTGSQSLTEFLAYNPNTPNNQNILDKLFKNDTFKDLNNTLKAEELVSQTQKNSFNIINQTRDYFVILRSIILPILAGYTILIIFLIFLAKSLERNQLAELRRILLFSGFSTITFALAIIVIIGGSSYLTSNLQLSILPGLSTAKIANIFSWQLARFSFNLVSTAVWIATGFFVLSIVLLLIDRASLFRKSKEKNSKLRPSSTRDIRKNPTLDGEFRRALEAEANPTNQNNQPVQNLQAGSFQDLNQTQFSNPSTPNQTLSQAYGSNQVYGYNNVSDSNGDRQSNTNYNNYQNVENQSNLNSQSNPNFNQNKQNQIPNPGQNYNNPSNGYGVAYNQNNQTPQAPYNNNGNNGISNNPSIINPNQNPSNNPKNKPTWF